MKKNLRHIIEVREVEPGKKFVSSAPYKVIGKIRRVLRMEQCGNFVPLFCCYKGDKRNLVHSDAGDISDPYRVTTEYFESLFIRVEPNETTKTA